MQSYVCIFPPTLLTIQFNDLDNAIQVSAHQVHSKSFKNELKAVFPNKECNDIILISTMQRAKMDLVQYGDEVELEKERLLLGFYEFGKKVVNEIANSLTLEDQDSVWTDYIDPCSGLPVLGTNSNVIFNEVNAAQSVLNYQVMNAGCCKVLLHPAWGSAVYPCSIVTTAPPNIVLSVLKSFDKTSSTP